jgi:hypothetical protein
LIFACRLGMILKDAILSIVIAVVAIIGAKGLGWVWYILGASVVRPMNAARPALKARRMSMTTSEPYGPSMSMLSPAHAARLGLPGFDGVVPLDAA